MDRLRATRPCSPKRSGSAELARRRSTPVPSGVPILFSRMSYNEPLITLFLLLCAVAWLRRGSGRERRVLLGVAVIGLLLVSWPPAEWVLSRPLESPYHPFRPAARPGAIVVLG